ncbi:bis(5'-nucleosyl)-tetraphosphatase, symmetrical-like protein [Novymonas esmeraldas]|uniref:Bis(5'-nucleosyl)-tetraphosphatase, symmetrical-like protein n=1 Tax=Novymonas esmeraldas TaxID=1808958 RepID=A0AAW0EN43_9TRYP
MSLRVVHLHGCTTGRLVLIGDIHGCVDELRALLTKVQFTNAAVRRRPSLLTSSSSSAPTSRPSSPAAAPAPLEEARRDGRMCVPAALMEGPLEDSDTAAPSPGAVVPPPVAAEGGEDVCVFVGDLVNKGPHSYEVVRCLRDIGAIGVLGNHDAVLLQVAEKLRAEVPLTDKERNSSLYPLAVDCPDDVFEFVASVPHVMRFHAYRLLVVHAGIDPSIPVAAQDIEAVTRMRNLAKVKQYRKQAVDAASGLPPHVALSVSAAFATLERPKFGKSWCATWSKLAGRLRGVGEGTREHGSSSDHSSGDEGEPAAGKEKKKKKIKTAATGAEKWRTRIHAEYADVTIVFGHDAKRRLQVHPPYAYGLDSGCVTGDRLTALVWPDTLVSVPGWQGHTPLLSSSM